MQLRLYRTRRDAELRRDLIVLIPLYLVKDEGHPRSFRKPGDGSLEIHMKIGTLRNRGRPK